MRGRPAGPAATLFDYASGRECLQMIDEMKRMRTSGNAPLRSSPMQAAGQVRRNFILHPMTGHSTCWTGRMRRRSKRTI